jgi:hypothetical protein
MTWVGQSGWCRDAICIIPPQLWQLFWGSGDAGSVALTFDFDSIDRLRSPVGNCSPDADDIKVAKTRIESGGEALVRYFLATCQCQLIIDGVRVFKCQAPNR